MRVAGRGWWLALAAAGVASAETGDPVLDVLASELARAKAELGDEKAPPYFLAAEIEDVQAVSLRAEDGALHGVQTSSSRHVDVDVRIGDPWLDSSHYLRTGNERSVTEGHALPIGDDPDVLRRELWREIDTSYRLAVSRWSKVQADRGTLVDEEKAYDLAPAPVATALEPAVSASLDVDAWSSVLRKASAVLAVGDAVRDGAVSLQAVARTSRFVNTEGTSLRHGRTDYYLTASLDTVLDDGSEIDLSTIWVRPKVEQLPGEEALLTEIASLRKLLEGLRAAPEQEPYSGPVVLSDRASGVFFHEIFGHRVEGHRLKRVDNAQTFRTMVGQRILPTWLDVVDDPLRTEIVGTPLSGHYRFDDEGVAAETVTLVDNGVLKGFLMGRNALGEDGRSNGHGRRQTGNAPVTRQGNLIATASQSVTDVELRKRLIGLAKQQGLPYALWIDRIAGGFTYTNRGTPNAFNVKVLVAWRVYTDGRPDELVRGIDLIGTPLDAFGRIVAAGEQHEVFNGVCGAESGWVPVSASAPALLVSLMETQRKAKEQQRPPLLPAPGARDGSTEVEP